MKKRNAMQLEKQAYGLNLYKLNAVRLFFWMFFFSSVMTPFFTQWGGLDLFQVFLLNAWFFFWNFMFEIPTGALGDRLGRKWSLALGSFVGTIATLVYILKPDFRNFLLAEMMFAFAFTLHSGADDALAYDSLRALGKAGNPKKSSPAWRPSSFPASSGEP